MTHVAFFWHLDQGTEPLRLAREIVADLPDDVGVVVPAGR
jgi:hypothetical protein